MDIGYAKGVDRRGMSRGNVSDCDDLQGVSPRRGTIPPAVELGHGEDYGQWFHYSGVCR